MLFRPALPAELPAVAALVNSAYRGESSRAGWATEADYLEGQRTDVAGLARDLAAKPEALLLTLRDDEAGPLLGSVWLEPADAETWYLGMLTIRPDLQDRQLGRGLLERAEALAKARGATRIRITVIHIRETLIAWYQRRGYQFTGAEEPFPHDDPEFGLPLRGDLKFLVMEKRL